MSMACVGAGKFVKGVFVMKEGSLKNGYSFRFGDCNGASEDFSKKLCFENENGQSDKDDVKLGFTDMNPTGLDIGVGLLSMNCSGGIAPEQYH